MKTSKLTADSSVEEIIEALPVGEVYKIAHNYESGILTVIWSLKAIQLWFPDVQKVGKVSRWRSSEWTEEQKSVQKYLEPVSMWMKSHPIETERWLIENSPRLAVQYATMGGHKFPTRFTAENEHRFFERCSEKPRFNKSCVRYCDHYGLFAPNMGAIMLEAGYGKDRRFVRYVKKMQKLKKHAAGLITEFMRFKGFSGDTPVHELIEMLES